MSRVRVPAATLRFLRPLAARARSLGLPLYVVGGPVRDWLLGRTTADLDLAVAGDPDPIAESCARRLGARVECFGRFGTRRVVGRGRRRVDVAATRAESYAQPAALPEVLETGVPIERDLARRDFSINAMACRLDDGSYALVDPFGGGRDLERGVLRVLHEDSLRDDPTRAFRAARFLGRFGFRPDAELLRQIDDALVRGHAARLSPHRLLHELLCLLAEPDPFPALHLLGEWGWLPLLMIGPAVKPGLGAGSIPRGVEQRLLWLALALGPERGPQFAEFFPFAHETGRRLRDALALARSDRAPRSRLDPLLGAALRRAFPGLAAAALRPCFLDGADLLARGLKPGPAFHEVLDEAARLQRRGELRSRPAALKWLDARVGN